MDPEGFIQRSHTRKDKYCMTSFIYMSNVTNNKMYINVTGEKKWLPNEEGLGSGPNGNGVKR